MSMVCPRRQNKEYTSHSSPNLVPSVVSDAVDGARADLCSAAACHFRLKDLAAHSEGENFHTGACP